MKKLSILLMAFIACTACAKAQSTTYHPFKVDIEGGADLISTYGALDFTIEPHYRLSDNFALGFRFQDATYNPAFIFSSGNNHINYKSYCVSGDYYLTQSRIKVFGGGAAGIFSQSGYTTESSGSASTYQPSKFIGASENLGFAPRIGAEAGHFRLSFEYDITGGDKNYSSINVGIFLGGGKKK